MATKTGFLQLILALNGEYVDTWDSPVNNNFQVLDNWADGIQDELVNARFGQVDLAAFLAVSINNDGTLVPTEEVVRSRNSFLYGDQTASLVDRKLYETMQESDLESFYAREISANLRDSLSIRPFMQNAVMKGLADVNSFPSWLGFTGADAIFDGSGANPIIIMIDGKLCRVRGQKLVSISGVAGTKYLYAQFNANGVEVVDGDSTVAPPVAPSGTVSFDGLKLRFFTDLTVDFTTKDVKAGDVLTILGVSGVVGQYQIKEVAPGANNNRLLIYGVFPGSNAIASLDYTIQDPMAATLGYDTVLTPAPGKFYIGEADFDSISVTAVRAIQFKDIYVSEWRAVDVSVSPTFLETFNHNLFSDVLDISVQVSQANNGSQPIEQLSLSNIFDSTAVVDTIVVNPGTFNPGSGDSTYSLPSKSGTVTKTGTVVDDRSCKMQFTRSQATIGNKINNVFYRDFSNAVQTGGYLRVIVTKKRN